MQATLQSTSHASTCIHCSIWVKMTASKILSFILEFLIRAAAGQGQQQTATATIVSGSTWAMFHLPSDYDRLAWRTDCILLK